MKKKTNILSEALGVEKKDHIAFVGGGGKTSLLFSLAGEVYKEGKTVLTSTTTKVWQQEAQQAPLVVFVESESWMKKLKQGLREKRHVFAAQRLLGSGKVEGIRPSLADTFYLDFDIDYLFVEADGSAGRPVKAPAMHEPVIPGSVTKVVALMGLEALGRRLEPEIVFRPELASKITGLDLGEELSTAALSKLFLHPEGLFKGSPSSAKRVAFLNKLDLLSEETKALELADLILTNAVGQIPLVIIGSLKKRIYLIRGMSHGGNLS